MVKVVFLAGAALAEGSKAVFPRSLHASFAGSILNSPHLQAALWLIAVAATAAWLAAAAAAAGLAAGSSRHLAASGGSGSTAAFGSGFGGAMVRNPSLRALGLQRFPSMPALSGVLGFRDPGPFSSGGGPQQSYAIMSSQPPAAAEPSYKAAKGNGSRMSAEGGRLPADSLGGGGISGDGALWADFTAAAAASNAAVGGVDWGPRMSPPPTPHGDAGGGVLGGSNRGGAQQQRQLAGLNSGGWAGGRTGAKRRGLR